MKISLDELKNKMNIAIENADCQLTDVACEKIFKTFQEGIEFPSDTNRLIIKCENLLDTETIEILFFTILKLKNIEVIIHHINHGWKSHKFDKNGNIIEKKSSGGYNKTYRYNDDNKLIFYKDDNYSYELKYDNNGNKIAYVDTIGGWGKWEYDENNRLLLSSYSDGYFEKNIYDTNGNIIKHENTNGYYYIKEYNKNNQVTYSEDSDGNWMKYTYQKNGESDILKSIENSDGFIKYFNEFGIEIEKKEIEEVKELKLDISFE